ncbi:MAG: glycosyltransferase family 9 protein [Nitrospinae bacterium]|nr:glycosyltransferase family 9 protein [Nitrospinota bacterium]MBL7020013.1 glycosyltransferase family 9 protein [Nitrospinaceae bacterium]
MLSFPREKLPKNPKFLIIKLRSIGDVVYNTAVYAPLKRSFPDCHLTVLVERFTLDVVRHHPDIDQVLCFEKKSWLHQLGFYYRLFADHYDVVIDMHEGTRGAVMCFVTQAPYRVGHKFAKRSFLYNVKLEFGDLHPKQPIDYQVALIKKMGVEFGEIAPSIHISESAKIKADKLLHAQRIDPHEPFCILHPGSRHHDRWEPEKFAQLADAIYSQHRMKTLWTCGPGQKHMVDEITPKIINTPYAFISTNLETLGAITQKARFVVCHDGGYMHFAAALGAPVVGMFGWTNPEIWRPPGNNATIVSKEIECRPCTRHTKKEECWNGRPECKVLITVEDILLAISEVYPANITN